MALPIRFLAFMLLILTGCMKTDYRVERIEGTQSVSLPLKFDSFNGVRDGESVKAEALFVDGLDSVQLSIALSLGPPIQFKSGTYRATVGGQMAEGTVSCESLTFLGGQAALPSVGGVFVLRDAGGRAAYRISMPPAPIKRRPG